jgi:hypothetical protein
MPTVHIQTPTWHALWREQRWTPLQLHWFMVLVGNLACEEGTREGFPFDGWSFALFGRGASQGVEQHVMRLLFPDSVQTCWIAASNSNNNVFAMSDQMTCMKRAAANCVGYTKTLVVPHRVILLGYQSPALYMRLIYRHEVLIPIRHSHAYWSSHSHPWTSITASVLSDASSAMAIPDLDYLHGTTALFLLGESLLMQTPPFAAQLAKEAYTFVTLCKATFHMHMSVSSNTKVVFPWCIGPAQFVAERVSAYTPLLPDIITSVLMPYLDEKSRLNAWGDCRWATPREEKEEDKRHRSFQTSSTATE